MNENASTDNWGMALAKFGVDLRDLRAAAGNPTYEAMARKAGLSLSLLSTVDKGRTLPSRNALRGYLVALGLPDTEIEPWVNRRDHLHSQVQNAYSTTSDPDPGDGEGAHRTPGATPVSPPRHRGRLAAGAGLLCAAALVGGFAAGRSTTLAHSWWPGPSSLTAAPQVKTPRTPVSGDDPYVAGCLDDAIPVAATTQADGTVIHLMWSQTCSANWGRITLPQNVDLTTATVTATVATTQDEADAQESTITGQQTVYTPILIVGVTDQACAAGHWTVSGATFSADQPACA